MKNKIFSIVKKELREIIRDKKSLIMMLAIPLIVPVFIIVMSLVYEIMSEDTGNNKIGFSYELNEIEEFILEQLGIDPIFGNEDELNQYYESDDLEVFIVKNENCYMINSSSNGTNSYTKNLAIEYLNKYKQYLQNEFLENNNISTESFYNVMVIGENIIDKTNNIDKLIYAMAFMMIIIAMAFPAMYIAIDSTSGEKERGTLETLLTFPLKNSEIIIGKFISVVIAAIIGGIISIVLAQLSFMLVNNFSIYNGVELPLSISKVLFTILIVILYALLLSGAFIAVTSKCKTFKEADSTSAVIVLLIMVPLMLGSMDIISTNFIISIIPFFNLSFIGLNFLRGNINVLNIITMIISTILVISILLKIIIKQYKSEKVLF